MSQDLQSIAVILPAYNSGAFLRLQVASIFAQSGVAITLFIMDDHSSDKTADVISDLRILYDNIKFVADNPKLGNASRSFFYLMFEMADELSEFDYVALADHDDIWIPSKLERAVARLNFTNSVAYSSDFCAVTFDSGEGIVSGKLHRKSQPQTPIDYVFEGPGPGCTFV